MSLRPLKVMLLLVCLVGLLVVVFWAGRRWYEARAEVKDAWSQSRFAHLKVALEIYHRDHGSFPPTKYRPVAGGPIYSWRILLVPYTTGDKRYSEYDFTKEWNSPSNLHALSGWPSPDQRVWPSLIFRMIGQGDGDTAQYLAIGEGDEWPSKKPLRSLLVTKGKDRFLLVEDPDSKIHWMEPKY